MRQFHSFKLWVTPLGKKIDDCQPITTAPSSRGRWTSSGCNPYLSALGDKQIAMLDNTWAEWLTSVLFLLS